jgi:hypothetical protein
MQQYFPCGALLTAETCCDLQSGSNVVESRKRRWPSQWEHRGVRRPSDVRLRLKCDGRHAETRFRLSVKRTGPFKSARASLQSTTGSRVVRIGGSNAKYTTFRLSVKRTGYPLYSPVSPSLPPPVRHRVQSLFNWTLRRVTEHTGLRCRCVLRMCVNTKIFCCVRHG